MHIRELAAEKRKLDDVYRRARFYEPINALRYLARCLKGHIQWRKTHPAWASKRSIISINLFLTANLQMENINTDVPLAELESVVNELDTFITWIENNEPQRKNLLAKLKEAREVFGIKLTRARVTGTVG